ncbi:hypothetical protein KCU99_g258, partial [Aureobasidium melanogenum]
MIRIQVVTQNLSTSLLPTADDIVLICPLIMRRLAFPQSVLYLCLSIIYAATSSMHQSVYRKSTLLTVLQSVQLPASASLSRSTLS